MKNVGSGTWFCGNVPSDCFLADARRVIPWAEVVTATTLDTSGAIHAEGGVASIIVRYNPSEDKSS